MGGRNSCRAETAASSEWRVASSFSGGQCSCTAEKFFGASEDAPSSYGILGSPGGSPSQTPNEFGA